ncbi:MAG: hypothetical protein ACO3JL_16340 [Myxococcota bacterium]
MAFVAQDLIVVGIGQLGTLFGEAALGIGRRVTPLRRDSDVERCLDDVPAGCPVLMATGEADLERAVQRLPAAYRDDLILVQNELFPVDLVALGIAQPTTAMVWSSKKSGRALQVGAPTEVFGRHADLMEQLHNTLQIPCRRAESVADRDAGLVAKFAFILTINALGLQRDLSLGKWLSEDHAKVLALCDDARRLGEKRLGHAVDPEAVQRRVLAGMEALADMPSRGRTALQRLEKARQDANRLGLSLPALLGT